jgi:uncharacterized membrane protein
MKRSIFLWQFAGLTFTAVLGTLLHFLFDWTKLLVLAPFSAVNESTWEHMKLMFFPSLIFAIIESLYFSKEYANYWKVKFGGILIGVLLIPILFYTINGSFGKTPDWLNILFFFISAMAEYYWEYKHFKVNVDKKTTNVIAILGLILIALAFIIFTFYPPQIPLFKDPLTTTYGI